MDEKTVSKISLYIGIAVGTVGLMSVGYSILPWVEKDNARVLYDNAEATTNLREARAVSRISEERAKPIQEQDQDYIDAQTTILHSERKIRERLKEAQE